LAAYPRNPVALKNSGVILSKEGDRTRNVLPGGARKVDPEALRMQGLHIRWPPVLLNSSKQKG